MSDIPTIQGDNGNNNTSRLIEGVVVEVPNGRWIRQLGQEAEVSEQRGGKDKLI
jgi:hypothetical protein